MKINFLKKFNQNQKMSKRNLILATLLLSILLFSSFVSAGWLTGRYTGKVTINGEMTQEKCDSYCPSSAGILSPSTKQCDCSPAEVIRKGRTYCTTLNNKEFCAELGVQTTANDGTEVTFRKEKTKGFFSKTLIKVNFKESTDSLSYQ